MSDTDNERDPEYATLLWIGSLILGLIRIFAGGMLDDYIIILLDFLLLLAIAFAGYYSFLAIGTHKNQKKKKQKKFVKKEIKKNQEPTL